MHLPSEAVLTDAHGNTLEDGTRVFFLLTSQTLILDPYDPGFSGARLLRGTIIVHRFEKSRDSMWLIDPDDKNIRPVFMERGGCVAEAWAAEHGLHIP